MRTPWKPVGDCKIQTLSLPLLATNILYFYSGQSHFVLLAMHLLIASSRVLCATIFRRAVQAPASRRKWRYLLVKSIFPDQLHHGAELIALL